jgi:hypothetical protein
MADGLHGGQYEQASRGNIYSIANATAGVAAGTAFSTTPPIMVWNPPNSGVNLVIREVGSAYRSGTLGAGVLGYGINASQQTAPSSGTALTAVQLNGSKASNAIGQGFTGSTISAAATIVKLGPSSVATLATAASAAVGVYLPPSKDTIEGGIIVPPGAVFTVEAYTAAGASTDRSVFSICWEEVSNA